MAKEEVLHCWLKSVAQIIHHHFIYSGKPFDRDRAFQHLFPEQLWNNITNFIQNLGKLPLWVNREASSTVFATKNNHQFWQTIFSTGRSPNGHKVLPSGLDLTEMIKP
jgi:hypothetical protein